MLSACRCSRYVCPAERNAETATPARISVAGDRSSPTGRAEHVGQRAPRRARTGERGQRNGHRQPGERALPAGAAEGDRRGDREAGAGGHPEQVRVGQRVAEHALVAAAGQGEQAADEQAQHHPGQPQLGDDRDLALGQPAVQVHPGDQVEQLGGDAARGQAHRAERHPGDERDEHRDQPRDQPALAQPGGPGRAGTPGAPAGRPARRTGGPVHPADDVLTRAPWPPRR